LLASCARQRHIERMADSDKQSDNPIQTFTTDESMHEAMRRQIAEMLANSDLTEQQKQEILVAMQCPCCGAGGMSLSFKLKD
jgi:hypothetical protein